ncbi:hypothetical protein JT31_01210 [Cedecea neteri]|uniref:Uncharacterized protein n=1 Tax=Cedecea neteri TaxID=158822 RepID=A0A089PYJ1_9ENTR|nr:hypothetical protein JT31_01210 [Cedecea neteri]
MVFSFFNVQMRITDRLMALIRFEVLNLFLLAFLLAWELSYEDVVAISTLIYQTLFLFSVVKILCVYPHLN